MSISMGYLQLCLLVLHTLNPAQGMEIGHPTHVRNVPEIEEIEGTSMRLSPSRGMGSPNTYDSRDVGDEFGHEMIKQNPDKTIVQYIQEKASGIALSNTKILMELIYNIFGKIPWFQSNTVIAQRMLKELDNLWHNFRSVYHENNHPDAMNLKAPKLFEELEVFQSILFRQVKDRFLHLGVEETRMKGFGPSSIENQTIKIGGLEKLLSHAEIGTSQETFFQELTNLFQRINFKEIEKIKFDDPERELLYKLQIEIVEMLKYMVKYKLTTREKITEFFKDDNTLFLLVFNASSQNIHTCFMYGPSSLILKKIFSLNRTMDIVDIGILNESQKRKVPYYFFKGQWHVLSTIYGDIDPDVGSGFPRAIECYISEVLNSSFDKDTLFNKLEEFRTSRKNTNPKQSGAITEKPESSQISGGLFDQIESLQSPQISPVKKILDDISNLSSKLETRSKDIKEYYEPPIITLFKLLEDWINEIYGRT